MLKRISLLFAIIISALSTLGFTVQLTATPVDEDNLRHGFAIAPNAAPTINAPPDQTLAESVSHVIPFTIADEVSSTLMLAVDGRALSPVISPTSGLVDASGHLTAQLLIAPSEADGPGTYPITVTVTDDEGPANVITATITLTVSEVNITPTIDAIANQSVDEGMLLNVPLTFADADLPANALTVTVLPALPVGAMLVTTTNTITWTPTEVQGPGEYPLTVAVTDGGLTATQAFTIHVAEVNEAPQIQPMSDATITESVSLGFTLIATDTDQPAQTLTFTMSSLPTSTATINQTGANTAQFDWTPTEAEGGATYAVEVLVTDGVVTSSTSAQITVVETNLTPILSIADQTITETMQLSMTLNGSDADLPGDTLIYSIPASTTTSAELNASTGLFQWTPSEADGGQQFTVTVDLTDGQATVSDTFTITVIDTNITPTVAAIADQLVNEEAQLDIPLVVNDADLPTDTLTITVLPALPTGATLVTATKTITWIPTEAQGPASYPLTVTVSDGALAASETFTIHVAEVNQAPQIQLMSDRLITESVPLAFTLITTDTDVPIQALTFTMTSQPTSTATINPSTGLFEWTPTENEGGAVYAVEIFVTDGVVTTSTSAQITVAETNEAPILMLADQTITETMLLSVTLNGSDADVPSDTLTYQIVASSTASAELNASTGLFQWTPTEAQGGQQFTVTVSLSDGAITTTDTFTITVIDSNVAPFFDSISAQQITETHRLTFTLTVTDTDDPPDAALTMTLATITPSVASTVLFTSSTGIFDWTPMELDGPQLFTATFVVTDGDLTGTLDVPINVLESNLTPTLAAIPAKTITETTLLSFTLDVTDPDRPANTFTYQIESNVTTSAEINNATGIFNWSPSDTLGGSVVTFTITVIDTGGLTSTQLFTVTVIEALAPPVLAQTTVEISETVQLNFVVPGSDVDIPVETLTYTLVASSTDSAEFDPTTHTFTWTPTELQGGQNFTATFSLSDGTFTVTETYTITVIETNVAPQFLPVSSHQVSETVQLTFTLGVTDADIPANTLSISLDNNAPTGATVNASTGLFSWTPTEAYGPGVVTVTFVVSDGVVTNTINVPITVFEVNQAPTLPETIYFEIEESVPFSTTVVASDADLPTNTLTYRVASYLPTNATFVTDTLYWTPDELAGRHTYQVTVVVSDGLDIATTNLHFTVTDTNSAPVIPTISEKTVAALSQLEFSVLATDPDIPADTLSYSLVSPPAGATIDARTGLFSWPNVMTGTTVVTVRVTDNGIPSLSATQSFTVSTGLTYVYIPFSADAYHPFSNGDFEYGSLAGWQMGGTIRSGVSTAQDVDGSLGIATLPPINGVFSAHLGDPAYGTNGAPAGYGELRRTITLPSDATKIKFQYRVLTHDQIFANASSQYFDTFEVYINDLSTADALRTERCINNRGAPGPVANGFVLCDGNPAAATRNNHPANMGLISTEIDISSLAGTNIELILRVYNRVDSSYNTWVYLDEIEVVNN